MANEEPNSKRTRDEAEVSEEQVQKKLKSQTDEQHRSHEGTKDTKNSKDTRNFDLPAIDSDKEKRASVSGSPAHNKSKTFQESTSQDKAAKATKEETSELGNDTKGDIENGPEHDNPSHTDEESKASPVKGDIDSEKEKKSSDYGAESKKPEAGKFVFGATSSFASGFGIAKGANVADKKSSDKTDEIKPKPLSFGTGLSFGGGFGVLNNSNAENSQSKESHTQEISKPSDITSKEPTPQFNLQMQDVKSGEESEDCIFQCAAKLYQLTDLKHGWKERGVGNIKVNRNKKDEKTRLVMRSRSILKVILNLPLLKGLKVQKGFPGSLQSEKFIRITAVDDQQKPLQYALKTAKPETTEELYDKITGAIPN